MPIDHQVQDQTPAVSVSGTGPVLVTGAAGFIGMHVCTALLERGFDVVGLDNLNTYYDPSLKSARLKRLAWYRKFSFYKLDISDQLEVLKCFVYERPSLCVHLAAQAGVRHSIKDPFSYRDSNLSGHLAILEACRQVETVEHLVYASSSSVYGERPMESKGFSEADPVSEPASFYAATKRACELMSTSYSNLYGMRQTGLRFFSVYGPWGRPDMAYYIFADRARLGLPIDVYNGGEMQRDFTYIDDVVEGILGVCAHSADPGENRILNIGGDEPVPLMEMIACMEENLGVILEKNFLPKQAGDVLTTHADISRIRNMCGYVPRTRLEEGISRFAEWYRSYYAFQSAAQISLVSENGS